MIKWRYNENNICDSCSGGDNMIIMIDIILEWIYSNIKFMFIVILFVNNDGHNWWQWYDRGWCNNMIVINIVIIYL